MTLKAGTLHECSVFIALLSLPWKPVEQKEARPELSVAEAAQFLVWAATSLRIDQTT